MVRLRAGVVLFALLQGSMACRSEPVRLPTAPTASQPEFTLPPSTANRPGSINGAVTDTAGRPLAGAKVEVIDGAKAGSVVIADVQGRFSFADPEGLNESTHFRASKEGHVTAVSLLQELCKACVTRSLIFSLESLTPPINITGDYDVTFVADGACAMLPDAMKSRTYAATIRQSSVVARRPPGTFYNVTMTDSRLLENYKSFYVSVAGNYLSFFLGNLDGVASLADPGIAEQVGSNSYFSIGGSGQASVEVPGTIIASFDGYADYCELNSAMGSTYGCRTGVVKRTLCERSGHQFIMTRR